MGKRKFVGENVRCSPAAASVELRAWLGKHRLGVSDLHKMLEALGTRCALKTVHNAVNGVHVPQPRIRRALEELTGIPQWMWGSVKRDLPPRAMTMLERVLRKRAARASKRAHMTELLAAQ